MNIKLGKPNLACILAATLLFALASTLQLTVSAQEETKGDSWDSINKALGKVEGLTGKNATATETALATLDDTKAKYDAIFREAAAELDPATEQLVEIAFADLRRGVQEGQVLSVTLNKQIIDKTIYKIAFMKIEEELLEEKVDEAAEWFTVMSKKFKYDQTPSAASNAMAELQTEPARIDELKPVILDGLRKTFLLKVKEEIAEALEAQSKQTPDNASAQKFAVEGISYYRTIQPDVKTKLGEEQEAVLFHELEEFTDNAKAGNLEKMQEEAEEINALLLAYEGKETTGAGAALNEIIDLLTLVNAEYIEAVENGQIINQEEYDEAVLFLSKAREKFDANKAEFSKLSPSETEHIEDELEKLNDMIQDLASSQDVSDEVQHVQDEVGEVLEAAGGGVKKGGWEYIATINELLDHVVEEYKEGNYEEARAHAREAYIDNYEFIEKDIEEDDPELMVKIELAMREELVKMIDDRRPASEIELHVAAIKSDLEIAKTVVVPEFSIAAIALASVLGFAVAAAKFGKFPAFRKV